MTVKASAYVNPLVFTEKCMVCSKPFQEDVTRTGYTGHHSCGIKGCETPIMCANCFKTHFQTHPRSYFNLSGFVQEDKK